MKTFIGSLSFRAALVAGLVFFAAGPVTAQLFTTLHSFTGGSDGRDPTAGLLLSGNTLYGTAVLGGSSGNGTVFALNTDGTGFTNLHDFTPLTSVNFSPQTNSDGAYPQSELVLSGNTLYGTAARGGTGGNGTVFAVNIDGTGFTNLHNFSQPHCCPPTDSDGANPCAGLVLSGGTLYGTAVRGGASDCGTVFALNIDGTGFTTLHSFTALSPYAPPNPQTNGDGANPYAGLILSGNTLYGTTTNGGSCGSGTVFAVNTDGTGFTNLHSFTALSPYNLPNNQTNSDGACPLAGLVLSGNALYGTTSLGGADGVGTVFRINTDGTGFTNVHTISGLPGAGHDPYGGLILSGNTLFGTTYYGGSWANGTVFALNTDGTGFATLYSLNGSSDGIFPSARLVLSGNTLYGAAYGGGPYPIGGWGPSTIFSLSFPPQLTLTPSGTNVILSWPTNVAGFDYTGYTLQSTTNLLSPAAWVTNAPPPIVVNGLNTVMIPVSGAQKFYRLIQ